MPNHEHTFSLTRRCGTRPSVESDGNVYKAQIEYHLYKDPKEKTIGMYHLFSFPIVEQKKNGCFAEAVEALRHVHRNKRLRPHHIVMVTSMVKIHFYDGYAFDKNEYETLAAYDTKDVSCARSIGRISDNGGEIFLIRTKSSANCCGCLHFFGVDENYYSCQEVCNKINYVVENAEDNFILEKHDNYQYTIDYKVLQHHVDVLNNIIKEVIDMAIIVARSIEARKKLEKKPNTFASRKKKDISLQMMALTPTSEEFIDLLQKVRLGLNYMARLNPFVSHPNVPELLHHMVAPFSLVTAVCGLELVKGISKPLLTSRAIWLIENCFTTTELSFWRSLGDNWNKPKCTFDPTNLFDDFFEPVFKYSKAQLAYKNITQNSLPPSEEISNSCNDIAKTAIVIRNHTPEDKQQACVWAGDYVEVLGAQDDFYIVAASSGIHGLVPQKYVHIIHGAKHEEEPLHRLSKRYLDNWTYEEEQESCDQICDQEEEQHQTSKHSKNVSRSSSMVASSSQRKSNAEQGMIYECTKQQKSSQNTPAVHSQKSSYGKISLNKQYSKKESVSDATNTDGSSQSQSKSHQSLNKSLNTQDLVKESSESCQNVEQYAEIEASGMLCDSKSRSGQYHFVEKTLSDNTSNSDVQKEKKKSESQLKKHKSRGCCWCCVKSETKKDRYFISSETKKADIPSVANNICQQQQETVMDLSIKSCEQSVEQIEKEIEEVSKSNTSTISVSKTSSIRSKTCQTVVSDSPTSESDESSIACVEENKSCGNEANQKAVSLLWEKSDALQEECIKIEGMKLFRVRIKMVPCDEQSMNSGCGIGKATLLVKGSDEVSLKPNSRISIRRSEKGKNTTKNSSRENDVHSNDSPKHQHKQKYSKFKDAKNSILEKTKEGNSLSRNNDQKHIRLNSAALKGEAGFSVCCEKHFDNLIQKTESIKHKPTPITQEIPIVAESSLSKDHIYQEKWQLNDTNTDDLYQSKNFNTEDVINIMSKYIPPEELKALGITSSSSFLTDLANNQTILEYCKNALCHDCGGVYKKESIDKSDIQSQKVSKPSKTSSRSSQSKFQLDSPKTEVQSSTADHKVKIPKIVAREQSQTNSVSQTLLSSGDEALAASSKGQLYQNYYKKGSGPDTINNSGSAHESDDKLKNNNSSYTSDSLSSDLRKMSDGITLRLERIRNRRDALSQMLSHEKDDICKMIELADKNANESKSSILLSSDNDDQANKKMPDSKLESLTPKESTNSNAKTNDLSITAPIDQQKVNRENSSPINAVNTVASKDAATDVSAKPSSTAPNVEAPSVTSTAPTVDTTITAVPSSSAPAAESTPAVEASTSSVPTPTASTTTTAEPVTSSSIPVTTTPTVTATPVESSSTPGPTTITNTTAPVASSSIPSALTTTSTVTPVASTSTPAITETNNIAAPVAPSSTISAPTIATTTSEPPASSSTPVEASLPSTVAPAAVSSSTSDPLETPVAATSSVSEAVPANNSSAAPLVTTESVTPSNLSASASVGSSVNDSTENTNSSVSTNPNASTVSTNNSTTAASTNHTESA